MLRFTRQADSVFYPEATGQPAVEANMVTGGICNSDGSTRLVMLRLSSDALEEGVEYTIRPRNEKSGYSWKIAEGLTVAGN